MNFKTILFFFIFGTLISCSHHEDRSSKVEDEVIFPDSGRK